MIRSGEEILVDIDQTLDNLIENAEAIQDISLNTLFVDEMQALQKTQESLLARLIHMNDLLDPDQKRKQFRKQPSAFETIEHKIVQFGKLNAEIVRHVKKNMSFAKPKAPRSKRSHKNLSQ